MGVFNIAYLVYPQFHSRLPCLLSFCQIPVLSQKKNQQNIEMAASDGIDHALTAVQIFQILTLTPCWAILAVLVAAYNNNHVVAPAAILCLFIVALLASIWAFCVLITQVRAHNTALWMAFWDIIFMAALIAGVVLLSNITTIQCTGYLTQITVIYDRVTGKEVWRSQDVDGNSSHCSLAKVALGLGIANVILFFISAVLSALIYQRNTEEDETIVREEIYTRYGTQYRGRSPSHRRHRYRHRGPMTGEYIPEENVV